MLSVCPTTAGTTLKLTKLHSKVDVKGRKLSLCLTSVSGWIEENTNVSNVFDLVMQTVSL